MGNALLLSLPAVVALLFKCGIFVYARYSHTHNRATRLYLYFLFALSIQNIVEISHFYKLASGVVPAFEFTVYYAAAIVALAILPHLTVALAFDKVSSKIRLLTGTIYGYAGVLLALLLATPWLIAGYDSIGYSVVSIHGSLYALFEVFALSIIVGVIGVFLHGARHQTTPLKRAKNALMLFAIVPALTTVTAVLVLLHFGVKWLNTAMILPVTITYFLIVTAYAIHQYRVFDIQFFIPWSKVRRRKTAFHRGIRKLIAEIADLKSPADIIKRLSDTLHCPVALVGPQEPVFAGTHAVPAMVQVSQKQLNGIDEILVAREIADVQPQLHAFMERHNIAAVVPFYPHSQRASGWLLLGDRFNEMVYSPLDFRLVEELFGKMADLFLDKLVDVRSRLSAATEQIHNLKAELEYLREENLGLRQAMGIDELTEAALANDARRKDTRVILVDCNKRLLARLREHFSDVKTVASISSAVLREQNRPTIMICRADDVPTQLIRQICEWKSQIGFLLLGPGARKIVSRNHDALHGGLVQVLPTPVPDELLVHQSCSMAELCNARYSLAHPDQPLLGMSPAFTVLMERARYINGFAEPTLLRHEDNGQAAALAHYLHTQGRRTGRFQIVAAEAVPGVLESLFRAGTEEFSQGTLMIQDIHTVATNIQRHCLTLVDRWKRSGVVVRTIFASRRGADSLVPDLEERTRGFKLIMPGLRERRDDRFLLARYFTLQFNLLAGTAVYLTLSEVEDLWQMRAIGDVATLKDAVYECLQSKLSSATIRDESGVSMAAPKASVTEFGP